MVGYFNYTVWMTYVSLLSGGVGIYLACSGHPLAAIFCLGISGFLDLFDGKIARTKKDRTDAEKHFGVQIDSLSDLVCFGVLPVCIGYAVGMKEWYFIPLLALFIVCGMIRLAYFNVQELYRNPEEKKVFYGVPITTSAFVIPYIYLFQYFMKDQFYILYACILGVLMISFVVKIRIVKPPAKITVGIAVLLASVFATLLILEWFVW